LTTAVVYIRMVRLNYVRCQISLQRTIGRDVFSFPAVDRLFNPPVHSVAFPVYESCLIWWIKEAIYIRKEHLKQVHEQRIGSYQLSHV